MAVPHLLAAWLTSLLLIGSAVAGSSWLGAPPALSGFVVPVQGSIYGDDPRAEVEAFNRAYEARTGSRPASQYAYPGYVLIDLWAKAVERGGTVEGAAVTAELEKMQDEATNFGPRTFTSALHHQNTALMQIIEITGGKPARVDEWRISQPVPLDVLIGG